MIKFMSASWLRRRLGKYAFDDEDEAVFRKHFGSCRVEITRQSLKEFAELGLCVGYLFAATLSPAKYKALKIHPAYRRSLEKYFETYLRAETKWNAGRVKLDRKFGIGAHEGVLPGVGDLKKPYFVRRKKISDGFWNTVNLAVCVRELIIADLLADAMGLP